MIPQKDLSVLQFWNFVGQMTRDNGLQVLAYKEVIESKIGRGQKAEMFRFV